MEKIEIINADNGWVVSFSCFKEGYNDKSTYGVREQLVFPRSDDENEELYVKQLTEVMEYIFDLVQDRFLDQKFTIPLEVNASVEAEYRSIKEL